MTSPHTPPPAGGGATGTFAVLRGAPTPLPAWLPMYRRPPPYGGGMDVVRQVASAASAQAVSSWALSSGTPVTDIRVARSSHRGGAS